MTRQRKRAYVPKVRGCYECSQRRINCDRGRPQCFKCITRGITCSGLGIRYRFNDDVASKGKSSREHTNEETVEPGRFTEIDEDGLGFEYEEIAGPSSSSDGYFLVNDSSIAEDTTSQNATNQSLPLVIRYDADSGHTSQSTAMVYTPNLLEPWKEYLLEHFSKRIAPEMAIIDDRYNGWRCFILPVAHMDNLVMDAVLSASAFHLSASLGKQFYNPTKLYVQAISRLREKQDLIVANREDKQSVLVALLVLLVTVIVNGYSDFPILFKLLESALSIIGGEDQLPDGELTTFLRRQIRKLRGFAAPLLSQPEGIARLSLEAADGWEDHWYHEQRYPNYLRDLSIVGDLQNQAGKIYTTRARLGHTSPTLTTMIENFQNSYNALPADSPVAHTLGWATFIAACESASPEHRQFFVDALMKHHWRNNFANIPNILAHLRRIWARYPQESWTSLLPEFQVFIT